MENWEYIVRPNEPVLGSNISFTPLTLRFQGVSYSIEMSFIEMMDSEMYIYFDGQ